jgi:hypothetical protein
MHKIQEGDKIRVIIKAPHTDFTSEMTGIVTEIEDHGFWMTADKQKEEFVGFDEIAELTFLV